jgi:hypothetical protein
MMRHEIRVDLFTCRSQKRPHNCQLHVIDTPRRDLPNAAQSGRPGAAKEIQEKCFDEVISVMTEENRPATPASRNAGEEFVTGIAPGGLDGLFGSPGQRGNVGSAKLAWQLESSRKGLNEFRVGGTRSAAQLMIEMADDEAAITNIR